MELRWPSVEELPGYVAALERGWSPNTMDDAAGWREVEHIERDAAAFLASQVDRDDAGAPIMLPDGSTAGRLPGYRRWMWDGEFCGSIGLRWQPGTSELPPHVLGHIGYSVVPWKQRRGHATTALRLLLAEVVDEGLEYVELTTHLDNVASQRVIEANGGRLVERFEYPSGYGGGSGLRYRVDVSI